MPSGVSQGPANPPAGRAAASANATVPKSGIWVMVPSTLNEKPAPPYYRLQAHNLPCTLLAQLAELGRGQQLIGIRGEAEMITRRAASRVKPRASRVCR